MFASPPEQTLEWSDEGVQGAHRFLKRVWNYCYVNRDFLSSTHLTAENLVSSDLLENCSEETKGSRYEIHSELKKALFDFERNQFNTVVSACMSILNKLRAPSSSDEAEVATNSEGLGILLRLLSPLAPHICHHLWRELGFGDDVLTAPWPQVDEQALVQSNVQYVVQVNGKVRSRINVPADADKNSVEKAALADEGVQKFIDGKEIKKVIVVPGKLVNLVAP